MIRKKNNGAALIIVIMVMAIMSILGITILNISLSQTMQVSNEDKRIQAHYLARSGAEAVLKAWEMAPSDNKPSGKCDTVYLNKLNNSNVFSPQASNMVGQFDITITNPDDVNTIITSVGTVGNVKQTTTVTISSVITKTTDPQGTTVSGSELEWYDKNSGQATEGNNEIPNSGTTVLVAAPGLKLVHGTTYYQADAINFTTDIWNFKKPLNLTAGVLIFDKEITTNRNGSNDGRLVLNVLESAGVNRNGKTGKWGRIKYNSEWYYYTNGTQILTGTDFNNLEKIPSADPNFPSSSSRDITSYSITWS